MKRASVVAIALAILFTAPLAGAQTLNPARFNQADHVVSGGFGLDGPIAAEAAYAPIVSVLDRRVAIPFRLQLPMRPSFGDFGLSAGVQLASIGRHGLGVSGRFELAFNREELRIAELTKLSSSVTLLGGWFRDRGSVAIELGWSPGLLTHVSPSDAYRRETYAGAHATWMLGGNGLFRAGVQGVLRVWDGTELSLRTGITRTENLRPVDLMPFYAIVGLNQSF